MSLSQPMPEDKVIWTLLTISLNAQHSILTTKPALFQRPWVSSPSSILDAYREGDLSFDGAVEALEVWKGRPRCSSCATLL